MSIRTPHIIEIPYGHPKKESIYINNIENTDWIGYKFQSRLNRMGIFEIELLGVVSSDQTNIAEGKEVMFFLEDQLKFKGIIKRVEYESGYSCMVYGYGMEIKLTYQQSARSEYLETATSDIVSTIASTCGFTLGTNTNWGNINIRNEHDDYLVMMNNLSNYTQYDWWVSHDYPFTNNKLNFDARRGSAASTFTFSTGGAAYNTYVANRQKEEVINKVTVLGYGDGVNQISTSFYDASATETTLNEDLTSSDTTITLTDAGNFASSGEIIIAEERITYSGKSGNNLTGCTRGANSTTAKAHPSGVYVAKYVAIDSPEAGSSILTNELRAKVFVDKSLINDETAQLYASKLLIDYKDSFERIVLRVNDQLEPTCVLGDEVTVSDADTGLSGDYKVVGIEWFYSLDTGAVNLFEVSNFRLNTATQIGELNQGTKIPSRYAQGATNCYMTGETDNCDSSNGLRIDFFVPDEAINVNSIKLNYRLSKYRIWHGTSAAGASHSHALTGVTSGSSDTTEYTNEYPAMFEPNNTVDCGVSPFYVIVNIPSAASGTFAGCIITISISNQTGSDDTYNYEIINVTDSNTTIASGTNWSITDRNGKTKNYKFTTSDVSAGDTIKFNISDGVIGTQNANDLEGFVSLKIQTNATHTHTFTGQTTDAETSHTHAMTYGISTGAYNTTDITISVDGVDKTSDIETAKGSALNATENSTENGSHMELSSYLSGTVAGAWHYVTITPNGNCRITADIYCQIFIESK